MIRRVARASMTASATAPTPPWTRVMPAAAIAAPVPVATAMPMSAAARAGASLMPSPTIATGLRVGRSRSTSADLSCGSSSVCTTLIPPACAVAVAASSVSPVASTGCSPSARSWPTPAGLSGRSESATPSSSRRLPLIATATSVCAAPRRPPGQSRSAGTPARPARPCSRCRPTARSFARRTSAGTRPGRTPAAVPAGRWLPSVHQAGSNRHGAAGSGRRAYSAH